MVATLLPLAFLAANSTSSRITRGLFDDTFAGIHQLSWFDWAILIPYFGILGMLSIYGMHRFETIRTYFKHRKKATGEPPMRFAQLPPGHDPAAALQRALRAGAADRRDGEDRISARAAADSGARRFDRRQPRRSPKRCANDTGTSGIRSNICTATNREGYKAGALQEGLKTRHGRIRRRLRCGFHSAAADFLTRTIHHFADPKVGVVQTRWSYLNRDFNFLTEVEAHSARRAFHSRARGPFARGLLLQFQRHRRHTAARR